jgi:hypothetical protein
MPFKDIESFDNRDYMMSRVVIIEYQSFRPIVFADSLLDLAFADQVVSYYFFFVEGKPLFNYHL